ncbi:unnamed protein product [Ceratitis capitata]|uniref:(Mediterranean fruit fly) hypothetical protein n=1 Tax=Ceratitis capitata TaxID=7213 RepID=A0A811UEJ8_CERCA|nr:unnamed protein product [Ceratitis capitata]
MNSVETEIPSTSSGVRATNVLTAAEIATMWNHVRVYLELGTREQCDKFSEGMGLILKSKLCPVHKSNMSVSDAGNETVG